MGKFGCRKSFLGLVLSEIVVSLGLLAIVGLATIGMFSYLAVNSQVNADRAAANLIADELLEKAVKAGPDETRDGLKWGVKADDLSRELQTADTSSGTTFTHQVDAERVESAPLGSLYLVTVRVAWEEEDSKNLERGKGWVKKSRAVYIEDDGHFR